MEFVVGLGPLGGWRESGNIGGLVLGIVVELVVLIDSICLAVIVEYSGRFGLVMGLLLSWLWVELVMVGLVSVGLAVGGDRLGCGCCGDVGLVSVGLVVGGGRFGWVRCGGIGLVSIGLGGGGFGCGLCVSICCLLVVGNSGGIWCLLVVGNNGGIWELGCIGGLVLVVCIGKVGLVVGWVLVVVVLGVGRSVRLCE